MRVPLSHDADGEFLMLAPEQAPSALGALALTGLRFREQDPDGAGCAGPGLVVLRFEAGQDDLQARLDAALQDLE